MKKVLQGATVALTLLGGGEAVAVEWMNNSVGFRYGQQFTNPNNPDEFSKRIYSFTHASGYQYGSNFLNLDVFLSDSRDPRKALITVAARCTPCIGISCTPHAYLMCRWAPG